MITLYLIRHGETEWNQSGRYQGATDVPLSPMGLKQAEKAAAYFKKIPLDGVISSPLSRARATAQGIADTHGLSLELANNLQELCFGDWEGKTFGEIDTLWPGMMSEMYHHPDELRLPHGESFSDCQKRTMAFIDELLQRGDHKTYAIVSHGVALRTIICGLIHIPLACSWNIGLSNASITTIRHYGPEGNMDGMNMLFSLNQTAHLEEAATPHQFAK